MRSHLLVLFIIVIMLTSACGGNATPTPTAVAPTVGQQPTATAIPVTVLPSAPAPTQAAPATAVPAAAPTATTAATAAPTKAASVPATPAAASLPAFEKAACPFRLPSGVKEGVGVDCGYLVVAEDRADPSSHTIRLAVAIFHNPNKATKPDPIIYLEGGPGGSSLEFAYLTYSSQVVPVFDSGRDVIFFDQRGVGLSQPALDCPAADELEHQLLNHEQNGKILTMQERDALELQATLACEKDLSTVAKLTAYNSAANAADVNDLRLALGYDQVNLWGISYGTRLALEVMRDYPKGIRSVVLDSVVPADANLDTEFPANTERVFTVLFDGCAADTACNTAYPNLRKTFFDTAAALDQKPATMTSVNPLNNKSYIVTLDGNMFMNLFFQMFYQTDMIPSMPQLIYDAKAGIYDELALFEGTIIAEDAAITPGMHYSVYCNEEQLASEAAVAAAIAKYTDLADFFQDSPHSDFALCAGWQSGKAKATESQPVSSDIQTLVMSGEYDPVTPPAWGKQAAKTLSKSYFFQYPGLGHGTSVGNDCPSSMMLAFIDKPGSAPDSSCIAKMTEPQFFVRTDNANITFDPVNDSQMGYSGVVPHGWRLISQGTWSRAQSSFDSTVLFEFSQQGVTSQQFAQSILPQLGVASLPDSSGSYKSTLLTWKLYRADATFQGQKLAIAYALADNAGRGYIVMVTGTASEIDSLSKAVLTPIMDAMKPAQ